MLSNTIVSIDLPNRAETISALTSGHAPLIKTFTGR
jgi:hypothetical protein